MAIVGQYTEEGADRVFTWNHPVVIGTHPSCEVRLTDRLVSSTHAQLYEHDGRWMVEDLGSTNGTFLNDLRVYGAPLSKGDRLRVGRTVITVVPTDG